MDEHLWHHLCANQNSLKKTVNSVISWHQWIKGEHSTFQCLRVESWLWFCFVFVFFLLAHEWFLLCFCFLSFGLACDIKWVLRFLFFKNYWSWIWSSLNSDKDHWLHLLFQVIENGKSHLFSFLCLTFFSVCVGGKFLP